MPCKKPRWFDDRDSEVAGVMGNRPVRTLCALEASSQHGHRRFVDGTHGRFAHMTFIRYENNLGAL